MAGKGAGGNPVPVGDLAAGILDPVLRRRAGISVGLVQSWEEIVGPRLSGTTRPERIAWPRRRDDDDPFEPAVLHVACEGYAAMALQHESGETIARINAFLGFPAIGRIRIIQKPVNTEAAKPARALRELSESERSHLAGTLAGIEDEGLRIALERLGASVARSSR
ncbi:MAG: DUF721 domain-containing protein [Rhizobiaceae bacterium]